MSKNANKPHLETPLTPEEIQEKRRRFYENALFAALGAICALVTGLGMYGDFKSMTFQGRGPASTSPSAPADINTDRTEQPYGY